jgi:flagellar protein FliO/FliZ
VSLLRRHLGTGLLLTALLAAGTAAAAPAPGAGVDVSALVRLIIGLAIVIGAIVAVGWLLRRMGGVSHNAGGQLQILGGLSVGQRERVVLIQVGQQQLLIGVAPGRVQTLHVLEQPLEGLQEPSRSGHAQDGSFADRLRRAMQQQREKR